MNGCGQCLRDCYILMIAVVLLSMILRNSNAYTNVYGPTVTLLETIFFWFFLCVLWKMDIDKLDGLVLLILLNFEPRIEMKSWSSFWICWAQKHFVSSFQLWHLQSLLWFVCLFVCLFVFFVDIILKENLLYSTSTLLFWCATKPRDVHELCIC